jgi:hypothetical protein
VVRKSERAAELGVSLAATATVELELIFERLPYAWTNDVFGSRYNQLSRGLQIGFWLWMSARALWARAGFCTDTSTRSGASDKNTQPQTRCRSCSVARDGYIIQIFL